MQQVGWYMYLSHRQNMEGQWSAIKLDSYSYKSR